MGILHNIKKLKRRAIIYGSYTLQRKQVQGTVIIKKQESYNTQTKHTDDALVYENFKNKLLNKELVQMLVN
jgi:hypothetical protein